MLRQLAIVGLMAVLISRLPGAPAAAEPDPATIIGSGSTNRPGFRIVVDHSGGAELTSTTRKLSTSQEQSKPIRRTLPRATIERFHADLNAAKPLTSLPEVHCIKSASFGSTLTVAFSGEKTPDLNCGDGGNVAMSNLIRDANEIIALFPTN
jgi:hypothetical protein